MNSKLTKFFGIISLLSISLVSTARSEGFTFSFGKFDHSDDKKNAAMLQLDYDFDNQTASMQGMKYQPFIT